MPSPADLPAGDANRVKKTPVPETALQIPPGPWISAAVAGETDAREAAAAGADRRSPGRPSARRDIPGAKIRHRRDAGAFGDDGRFGDLQGRTNATQARLPYRRRQMMNGLSVRADQVDGRRLEAGSCDDPKRRPGEPFAKHGVEMADI